MMRHAHVAALLVLALSACDGGTATVAQGGPDAFQITTVDGGDADALDASADAAVSPDAAISVDAALPDAGLADAALPDAAVADAAWPDGAAADLAPSDGGSPADLGPTSNDPFDPGSCTGVTIGRTRALTLIGAGNLGAFIGAPNAPLYVHTRTCTAATGCGAWSAATIDQDATHSFLMRGTLRLRNDTDPNATIFFSVVDEQETSPNADLACALTHGAAAEADCTKRLQGGAPGYYFCYYDPTLTCPNLPGTFAATVTDHCARFHGGSPTKEWALLVRY